ncbi:zinc finger, CCHC-type containing protein [Tanacetum coccineum]
MDIHLPPPPLPFPAIKLPTWQSHTPQDQSRRLDEIFKMEVISSQELIELIAQGIEAKEPLGQVFRPLTQKEWPWHVSRKGKAVPFYDGPPPSPLGLLNDEGGKVGEDGGDLNDLVMFKEAGLLDEGVMLMKDHEALVEKTKRLKKEELIANIEKLRESLSATQETVKREEAVHFMVVSEVEKRADNLKKALDLEKRCRADSPELGIKLEVEENMLQADAKLAEANRKSLELERKMQALDSNESVLQSERRSFIAGEGSGGNSPQTTTTHGGTGDVGAADDVDNTVHISTQKKKVKYGVDKYVNYSSVSKENYVFSTNLNKIYEPKNYNEACKDSRWIEAMNVEMEALNRNVTWYIIELPVGRKAIGCKWVFKVRYRCTGDVERFKARLVAKSFNQKEGIDYEKTFSRVVKIVTVRLMLTDAIQYKWPIYQLYINNAFLYGELVEDVYVELPDGYFDKSDKRVCKLVKSLYWLKQAPRKWNEKLKETLLEHKFIQMTLHYLPNLIKLKYFLGVEVLETENGICLNQIKYCLELLAVFAGNNVDIDTHEEIELDDVLSMVKEMTMNFGKLDKFKEHDFRGHILNGMSDSLFDVYTNVEAAKELWDSLESKYMAEDSSSKKFLVSNFNNYKMVDSRLVMEQYNELLRIPGQYTKHGLKMDESISVSSIIDKLPPSWKDFKHTLKHGKDDLALVQLGSHLRIEESLRAQDSDKGKGKKVARPSVNMTEEVVIRRTQMLVVRERGLRTIPKTKVDAIAWWIDSGTTTRVCKDRCWFKTYEPVEDGSVLYIGDDHFAPVYGKGSVVLEFSLGKSITLFNVLAVVRLPNPKQKTLGEKGIDCIFVRYAEHSKTYRFYVIEPNDSVSINSIIESRDAIFDENSFSSIPRPKDIIPNLDESQRDDHSDDVPSEIPEPRKGKRVQKAKSYGSDFQLYLVEGSSDQVGS